MRPNLYRIALQRRPGSSSIAQIRMNFPARLVSHEKSGSGHSEAAVCRRSRAKVTTNSQLNRRVFMAPPSLRPPARQEITAAARILDLRIRLPLDALGDLEARLFEPERDAAGRKESEVQA